MQLTPEQRRAVQSWQRGDICVVAGPGSGKTRVLVERLRWLITERRVQPERILAITFTEKAALEMYARLVGEGRPASEHQDLFEAAQISTIDAFCSRLLREHALEADVDPGYEILDANEADELLATAVEQALDEAFVRGGPGLEAFLGGYVPGATRSAGTDATSIHSDLASLVYRIRSHGGRPFMRSLAPPVRELAAALRNLAASRQREEFAQAADEVQRASVREVGQLAATLESIAGLLKPVQKRGGLKPLVGAIKDELLPACRAAAASAANAPARKWLRGLTCRILDDFATVKRAAGRLDFDDALALAAKLLESPDCPALAYEHILIDEFQDTNPLQVSLVDRLLDAHGKHRPVRFVVGDINQSIYGFRHADQNVFREYRERVVQSGGDMIHLLDNFRSRPEVLAAVHQLLPGGTSSGIEQHRLRAAHQFPPKALSCLEVQIVCDAGAEARTQEALWLAQRLGSLRQELTVADRRAGGCRRVCWRDVAILVRTHAVGAVLAGVLRKQGIPCQTVSDMGLFQAPETAELAAFLRVVRNPRDEISLAAVLKSHFCGITDASLLQLRLRCANLSEALASAAHSGAGLSAGDAGRLARFSDLLTLCRADRATVSTRFLLARAVTACDYRSFLAGQEDSALALAHLDQLLEWVAAKEQRGLTSLAAVSAALDQALETKRPEEAAAEAAADTEAVQVLTMHAAKGLEFPVVVLAALQSQPATHLPGLLFSRTHGIGARWCRPFVGGPVPDIAYAGISADIAERERTEAERLLYVAMTRAEEHLILSASYAHGVQRSGWFKTVLDRLDLDANQDSCGEPEERMTGGLRFRYHKTSRQAPCSAARDAEVSAQPDVLVARRPSAQADYSAAVTAVAVFAECPRKYFLSRYLGLDPGGVGAWQAAESEAEGPQRGRDGTDASLFGQQVHAHLAGQLPDPSPQVRELAARFTQHELGLRASRARLVDREMALVFTVGESLLRGTVDLLFEEGGEYILVDYKTDRRASTELEVAAEHYAPQLQLYAAGLAKAGKPVNRAIVFYLRHGKPIDIDVSANAFKAATRLVEEFFAAQRSQAYPLREGTHCRHCPHFRGACPAQPNLRTAPRRAQAAQPRC